MMRRLLISSVFALLIAWSQMVLPARAAETIRFAQDDLMAWAIFSSTDPSGCVLTEVSVFAVDGRQKNGSGPGDTRSESNVTISRYDSCTDTLLLAADGTAALGPGAFSIDGVEAATLTTSMELFDSVAGSSFVVDVGLTWEGIGDPRRMRDHLHIMTRAFSLNFRFDGTYRSAAAAGAVSDGTTNFTPNPGIDNTLWTIRSGSVQIARN